MNDQNQNDNSCVKDGAVSPGASPAIKPADKLVEKAKERWEGEGGSAPGKLNQDHPIPDIQINDGAEIKS